LRTFAQVISDDEKAEISARIKVARTEAGLKQREMAERLHIEPRTYQNYERTRVPWVLLKDIARITGKSHAWLLHGDDGPDVMDVLTRMESELHEIRERVDQALGITAPDEDEPIVPRLGDARP
jgi:transcriptional regulator with XRE-family HTH domain